MLIVIVAVIKEIAPVLGGAEQRKDLHELVRVPVAMEHASDS